MVSEGSSLQLPHVDGFIAGRGTGGESRRRLMLVLVRYDGFLRVVDANKLVLHQACFAPHPTPGDRWQHLETFLVVTTEGLLLVSGV